MAFGDRGVGFSRHPILPIHREVVASGREPVRASTRHMSRPEHTRPPRCFVPPAAQTSAAAGILCVIFGIAATALSWLSFETSDPAIAVGCGVAVGGLLYAADHWRRRKFAPPTLRWDDAGLVVEGGGQRVEIAWPQLVEVRHLDLEIETLELYRPAIPDPVVIVLDHFSPEQADEIRRSLRPAA